MQTHDLWGEREKRVLSREEKEWYVRDEKRGEERERERGWDERKILKTSSNSL